MTAQRATFRTQDLHIHTQAREPLFAFRCDLDVPVMHDGATGHVQRIGDRHAEAAGEVIVAGAGVT